VTEASKPAERSPEDKQLAEELMERAHTEGVDLALPPSDASVHVLIPVTLPWSSAVHSDKVTWAPTTSGMSKLNQYRAETCYDSNGGRVSSSTRSHWAAALTVSKPGRRAGRCRSLWERREARQRGQHVAAERTCLASPRTRPRRGRPCRDRPGVGRIMRLIGSFSRRSKEPSVLTVPAGRLIPLATPRRRRNGHDRGRRWPKQGPELKYGT